MFIHDGNDNKVGEKNIKDSRGDMTDKSREKKEQYNHSTQASSEHQPNYEVQLLQAKQEINELQLKVRNQDREQEGHMQHMQTDVDIRK